MILTSNKGPPCIVLFEGLLSYFDLPRWQGFFTKAETDMLVHEVKCTIDNTENRLYACHCDVCPVNITDDLWLFLVKTLIDFIQQTFQTDINQHFALCLYSKLSRRRPDVTWPQADSSDVCNLRIPLNSENSNIKTLNNSESSKRFKSTRGKNVHS